LKAIKIFAVRSDILRLLKTLEAGTEIKYIKADSSSVPTIQQWSHGSDLPKLGIADGSQSNLCQSYLLSYPDLIVQPRQIEQPDGTLRFDVDQLNNPDSIVFTPAGEWKDKVILAGSFGTASLSPASQSLMKAVAAAVRKNFSKVRAFWVGPEALAQWKSGKRLTIAEQSPSVYDLQEED